MVAVVFAVVVAVEGYSGTSLAVDSRGNFCREASLDRNQEAAVVVVVAENWALASELAVVAKQMVVESVVDAAVAHPRGRRNWESRPSSARL